MSSKMSMFRMPSHTWSPSTNPIIPTRMSTTPMICAYRLTAMPASSLRLACSFSLGVYVRDRVLDNRPTKEFVDSAATLALGHRSELGFVHLERLPEVQARERVSFVAQNAAVMTAVSPSASGPVHVI